MRERAMQVSEQQIRSSAAAAGIGAEQVERLVDILRRIPARPDDNPFSRQPPSIAVVRRRESPRLP